MWQPFLCGDVKLGGTTGGVYTDRAVRGARPRGLSSRPTVAWLLPGVAFSGGAVIPECRGGCIYLLPANYLSGEGLCRVLCGGLVERLGRIGGTFPLMCPRWCC